MAVVKLVTVVTWREKAPIFSLICFTLREGFTLLVSMLEELYEENLVDEPNNIEEIIEGDDQRYERENNSVDNQGDNLDGNGASTATDAAPKKKRVIQNPQPKLNPERLKGPRGIAILEDVYKDFKFNGKGYERVDLNRILKRLEHWAHRLYPRFQFDDCLEKIENLGSKKPVMTYVNKIRMDLLMPDEPMVLVDDDEDAAPNVDDNPPIDKFDELLSQQLAQLQSHTPQSMPGTSRLAMSTPMTPVLPMSSPVTPRLPVPEPFVLTEKQKETMHRNRLLAEEKKLARLKRMHAAELENQSGLNAETSQGGPSTVSEPLEEHAIKPHATPQQLPVDKNNYLLGTGSEQLEKDDNNTHVSGVSTLQQMLVEGSNGLCTIVPEYLEEDTNLIPASAIQTPQELLVISHDLPAATQQSEVSNNETQVSEVPALEQLPVICHDLPYATEQPELSNNETQVSEVPALEQLPVICHDLPCATEQSELSNNESQVSGVPTLQQSSFIKKNDTLHATADNRDNEKAGQQNTIGPVC